MQKLKEKKSGATALCLLVIFVISIVLMFVTPMAANAAVYNENTNILTVSRGDDTQLSKNFIAYEMDCKCGNCSETPISLELIETLQKIRDHFGKPVIITSGYRCPAHNAAVGGAKASYHMKGMAADIMIDGVSPQEVAQYAQSIGVRGIGRYQVFNHIDVRPVKYYWINDDSTGHRETGVQGFGTDTLKPDATPETPPEATEAPTTPEIDVPDIPPLETEIIDIPAIIEDLKEIRNMCDEMLKMLED